MGIGRLSFKREVVCILNQLKGNEMSCDHFWISNSGKGGEPEFNDIITTVPVMHVKCNKCNVRTFFSEYQWNVITGKYTTTGSKELP